jgi:hypothetical protein
LAMAANVQPLQGEDFRNEREEREAVPPPTQTVGEANG